MAPEVGHLGKIHAETRRAGGAIGDLMAIFSPTRRNPPTCTTHRNSVWHVKWWSVSWKPEYHGEMAPAVMANFSTHLKSHMHKLSNNARPPTQFILNLNPFVWKSIIPDTNTTQMMPKNGIRVDWTRVVTVETCSDVALHPPIITHTRKTYQIALVRHPCSANMRPIPLN